MLENLDFSPLLLQPFLDSNQTSLCLDIGHLWLGREDLKDAYLPLAFHLKEIHLHGVLEPREHLGLNVMDDKTLIELGELLSVHDYHGLVNLEVFSFSDLQQSLTIVNSMW